MKTMTFKALIGAAAGALLLISGPALADIKIGTIRAADLVQQSPQYKAGADRIKSEFERRKNDLEADMKKFQDDVKKYQKEGDLMSASDRAKTEKDLNSRQVDLGYRQKQFQEDFQNRDQQLTSTMMTQIKTVIEQVAKDKNLDLVLQDPVYATPSIDITEEVLKRLQQAGASSK